MWNEIKFMFYSIQLNLKNSAELRTSFLTSVVGMAINDIAFIVIWGTFANVVGAIGGWNFWDIVAMQGILSFNVGFVTSVFRGVDSLWMYVGNGSFDRILLSPKNILARTAVSALGVSAIGDILFGIICLAVYTHVVHLSALACLYLFLTLVISTVMMFSALLLIQTFSFYVADTRTATRGLWEFFWTPANFHGGAFQGWMRLFFTFVIPSMLMGSIPVEIVKNISLQQLGVLTLLVFLWSVLSVLCFYRGVRYYESANLTTFGS